MAEVGFAQLSPPKSGAMFHGSELLSNDYAKHPHRTELDDTDSDTSSSRTASMRATITDEVHGLSSDSSDILGHDGTKSADSRSQLSNASSATFDDVHDALLDALADEDDGRDSEEIHVVKAEDLEEEDKCDEEEDILVKLLEERAAQPDTSYTFTGAQIYSHANKFGPNVCINFSSLCATMEEFVVKNAAHAIYKFQMDGSLIARRVKDAFESTYGARWNCIAGNGSIAICGQPEHRIGFTINTTTVCLFRNQSGPDGGLFVRRLRNPDPAVLRRTLPPTATVFARGMNRSKCHYAMQLALDADEACNGDCEYISKRVLVGFEDVYGSGLHCAVSNEAIGFCTNYDADNHAYFRINDVYVYLFREYGAAPELLPTLRTSLVPSYPCPKNYVIASTFEREQLQYAFNLAQLAVNLKLPVNEIPEYIRSEFEERYGSSYHCVISNDSIGFFAHTETKKQAYIVVDSLYVFLFCHEREQRKTTRPGPRYLPTGLANADIRVLATNVNRQMERCALDLASEGLQRFPYNKMRVAQHVVERFEDRYGGIMHCALSEDLLLWSVHHTATLRFRIGPVDVLLYKNSTDV